MYNQLTMKGFGLYYLCNTCYTQMEKQDKMPEMKKKTAAASASQVDISEKEDEEDDDKDKGENEEDVDDEEGEEELETVSRKEKNDQKKKKQKEKKEAAKKICLHYQRNHCKYGVQGAISITQRFALK